MSRLQKKCLIGSAGFHLLLVLILLVGPAFLSSHRPPDDSQTITMFDVSKLTDGPTVTGGTPSQPAPVAPSQPAPPAPTPPPQAAPQAAVEPPAPVKPVKPEEPAVEPAPKKVSIKAPNDEAALKVSSRPKIEVSQKVVKVSGKKITKSQDDSEAKAAAAAANAARRERAAAFSRALGKLEDNLSTGTEVSVPGPGAETFVNYRDAVRVAYMQAWIPPTDALDDHAATTVSVTIARDGTVTSARIKAPSGDAVTDRSVEQTLRRVKFIAPFPEGATDAERTFVIKFDLTKKSLG